MRNCSRIYLKLCIHKPACAQTPNPGANSRPLGPIWWFAAHLRQSGLDVQLLSPAYLNR